MSVKLMPPSVERMTARPFELSGAPAVERQLLVVHRAAEDDVSGLPGGETTNMSYEH